MSRIACLGLLGLELFAGCSGNVSTDTATNGGTSSALGGSTADTKAPAAGGNLNVGGAIAQGGLVGLGGTRTSIGGASTLVTNTGGNSGINCALVGCGAPPLCSVGCTETCGCCPCSEGSTNGALVCHNGCWAPGSDTGGASSAGGAQSTGGAVAVTGGKTSTGGAVAVTGGKTSTGGNSNSLGGSSGTAAGGACGSGCTYETSDSPFCTAGLASFYCHGPYSTNLSSLMSANGCTMGMSDAIRFCCPESILTSCQ